MWFGLAYIGLPLAIQFARSGATVIGLGIDQAKIDQINAGRRQDWQSMKANGLIVSTDFSNVKDASAVIICVTAPLNKNREPDISFILETGAPLLVVAGLKVIEGYLTENLAAELGRSSQQPRQGFMRTSCTGRTKSPL